MLQDALQMGLDIQRQVNEVRGRGRRGRQVVAGMGSLKGLAALLQPGWVQLAVSQMCAPPQLLLLLVPAPIAGVLLPCSCRPPLLLYWYHQVRSQIRGIATTIRTQLVDRLTGLKTRVKGYEDKYQPYAYMVGAGGGGC
jgi:hypothetical protein